MTREDQFIGQLEAYLDDYEGVTALPDAIRDAVRAEIPSIRQIGPGRVRSLNLGGRIPLSAWYGLVAAAVVTVVIVSAALFGLGQNVGNEQAPTPPPPQATLISPSSNVEAARPLAPGSYYVDSPFPVQLTFDVPQGFRAWAYTAAGSQLNLEADGGEVSFEIVDNLAADPCTRAMLDPPVGPTVDDLVTALSNLPGFEATPATDVTVDGFQGMQLTLTAPVDASCAMLTWKTTTRQNGVGPGETNEVRIVDVNGVRLLICVAFPPETPAAAQSNLRAVADSVEINR
jgi:hypothetical protein